MEYLRRAPAYNERMKAFWQRMGKVGRILWRGLPFLFVLTAAVLVFLPQKSGEAEARTVVRVWNIDTFEGGKGSRTAFLKSVARGLRGEAYYLVTSYTLEGALSALAEGDAPDVLSFGVGLSAFAERLLPLPYSFAGGELGGKALAYPWCMGGYYLFSLTDFEGEGRTALSVGGENLPVVAARLEGIAGEETESVAAYTGFLSGKYRYLLGTQRDVCRFQARGVTVQARPLTKYCDLYQYIGILSSEKREASLAFVEALLSPEVQGRLSEIGMFPLVRNAERTVSVFSSREALGQLAAAAREGDVPEKYLKSI